MSDVINWTILTHYANWSCHFASGYRNASCCSDYTEQPWPRRKRSFVESRWFLTLLQHFTASVPDDDGKNSIGILWLLLQWDVHNIFKETLPFKADEVMQRKTTVKAKCVQHELHLSFIIIPSGSRISSSCNRDKPGSSKQEFSWLLQSSGETCGKWGDLAWWHHMAISNHFVRSLLLFLRQLSNHSGALGVWGMGERFTLC